MSEEHKDRADPRLVKSGFGLTIGLTALMPIVVAILIWTGTAQWQEVVGFFDWLSRATAFGALFAGVAALIAARWAYRGVMVTVQSAEQREQETREKIDTRERAHQDLVDTRERETARHERFTIIVSQLASSEATVRLGGLFAVSALADEWEREARRIIEKSPVADEWYEREKEWQNALHHWRQTSRTTNQPQALETDDATLPTAISGKKAQPDQPVEEATQLLISIRSQYALARNGVPPQAKDAVTQRDACLEMVTAYLRGIPIYDKKATNTEENEKIDPPSPELIQTFPTFYAQLLQSDQTARATAVDIIRSHTLIDAIYPWPSDQINLKAAQLELANLEGAHLQKSQLSDANLLGANLAGTQLHASHLTSANLQDADLTGANLQESDLTEANLQSATLNATNLRNAKLGGSNLNHAYLTGAMLQDAKMDYAELQNAHLSDTNLQNAILEGADLRGADLRIADLQNADLEGADLKNADLRKAHMQHSQLAHADLQESQLIETHLQGAHLFEANLQGAYLIKANLQGADLRNAQLQGAHVHGACFHGADLGGANLKNVKLTSAHLGSPGEGNLVRLASSLPWMRGAIQIMCDETTVWPDNFNHEGIMEEQMRNIE